MSTLADINQVLQNQTSVLKDVASSTASTNSNLDRFIRTMQRKQDGDDLEAEREKGNQRLFQSQQQKSNNNSTQSTKDGFFSNFQAKDLLTPGLLLSNFAPKVAKTALRAVPAALALAFAEDINKWVKSQTGSADLADAAERAAIGGTFGALISKRFGLIGLAVGALATEENTKVASDLGQAIIDKAGDAKTAIQEWANSESAKNLAEKFGTTGEKIREYAKNLPAANEILSGLQTGVNNGLVGLTGFINGGFDDKDFQNNWEEAAGVLTTFAFFLGPGKFMRAIRFLAKFKTMAAGAALFGAYNLLTNSEEFLDDNFTTEEMVGAAGMAAALGYTAVKGRNYLRNRANPGRGGAGGNTAAAGSTIGAPRTKSGRVLGEVFETKNGGRMKVMQNAKGGLYTQSVPKSTALGVPDTKWWKRFPRIRGIAGVPGLGAVFTTALSGAMISAIMADNSMTKEEKIMAIGPLLGSALGAGGLAAVGGALGAFGGPAGIAVGSIIGGLAGFGLGDLAGTELAKYILGKKSSNDTSSPNPMSNLQGAGMGSYDFAFDDTSSPSVSRPKVSSGVAENQAVANHYSNLAGAGMGSYGGDTNIGQLGDNTTNNVSSQPIMLNSGVIFDPTDMVLAR